MSNRRLGGPQRGNRGNFSQPFQGGGLGVSPWQGGMSSGMGNQGGLISQLTSNPQQLALALTSLLQNQQPVNPPSLLSLNTTPAYSHQDRDFNRFGNRGRDMRRHEPYNKNRQGWNRNRNQNQKNQQKGGQKKDGKKDEKKTDKSSDKKKGDDADETIDLSMDEDKEEETKRDWKDEKNTSSEDKDGDIKGEGKKNKEGRFHGVPVKLLNCFICNKEMWDGESMEKHLKGKAHQQMFKALEESIHITVNILRENMRLAEDRKLIEWNRMHRLKKFKKFQEFESNCNMCDLKFLGKITSHRKTEGHQRLKRYLHPDCNICNKEFPSRLDWIEHRLTAEHLRKLAEHLKDKVGGVDGAEIIVDEENDLDIEPLLEEPLQLENENPILELDASLDGLQNQMPAYRNDRAVSTKSLKPFSGFMCELCNRSFTDEVLAQEHLKTKRHYSEFVGKVKEIYLNREKEKKEKETASKENEEKVEDKPAQEGEEQNIYNPEEATNESENEEDADETITNGEAVESTENDESQTKMEEDEEEEEDETEAKEGVKEEKKEQQSPAKATRGAKSNVRNGAGPKSKKARKN